MPFKEDRFSSLLYRIVANEASEEDLKEFWYFIENDTSGDMLDLALENLWHNEEKIPRVKKIRDDLYEEIHKKIKINKERKLSRWLSKKWLVAASFLLVMIGLSISFLFIRDKKNRGTQHIVQVKSDILPGRNGAILKLGNGMQILLDSASDGNVATQTGANIIKKGAVISYQKTLDEITAPSDYNTIITPKGRQFCIKLSDGTLVWLNAASSLKYPTNFNGKDRIVELNGEGYFEVAKDPTKPFHVKVGNNIDIRVLGTHFNVNAYRDEPFIRTALAEGSVKVMAANQSNRGIIQIHTIKPGQQAVFDTLSNVLSVSKVNIENAIAWKDGYIALSGMHIPELMRELSRWYDVDIVISGSFHNDDFVGRIPRNEPLSKVLEILEKTDIVHFSIDRKKVYVSP